MKTFIGIFLGILVYFLFGLLTMAIYALVKDEDFDFHFCGTNSDEQNYAMILIWAFWPIAIVVWILRGIIWFIVHLYMALEFFYNKFFKENKTV